MDKSKLGLIHIYTGDGKGKTTAALGLILRASGRGLHVVLGQFLKYCRQEETDLLVLDEVIGACGTHLLDESLLIDFLKHKPEHLEVVMTGRSPSPELLEQADYVSEICKRKHPFDKGIPAREGIEK